MRKGGSKAKGSSFERKIAKLLSNHFFGTNDSFVRTPSSGALATIRKSNTASFAGDIMQVDSFDRHTFPFCIECKHYKKFNPFNLLVGKKGLETKAWEQAIENCTKSSLPYPILIFRENNQPIYCVTRRDVWIDGGFLNLDGYPNKGDIYIIPLEKFLNLYSQHLVVAEYWKKNPLSQHEAGH